MRCDLDSSTLWPLQVVEHSNTSCAICCQHGNVQLHVTVVHHASSKNQRPRQGCLNYHVDLLWEKEQSTWRLTYPHTCTCSCIYNKKLADFYLLLPVNMVVTPYARASLVGIESCRLRVPSSTTTCELRCGYFSLLTSSAFRG
jgi:hypothetical protein